MKITRRALSAGGLAAAASGGALAQPDPIPWRIPDDAAIKKILIERIDVQRQGVGIVVGVVDAKGRRIVSHGALAKGDPRPLNGDTVFEIGSMTKVFTSLLLTDMVAKGEVKLDDPVAKYLPAAVKVPERGGKQITLLDLATQTSGLPRMPSNFAPKDPLNPYADYTPEQLYAFLGGYALPRDIGAQYEYSNLGVGLLGHALARRAGQDYAALFQARIARPLGLKDTAVALSPSMTSRLAIGHTPTLEPTANWEIATLEGAGALRSTTNDMLGFLAAELGFAPNPLKPAMDAQFAVRRPAGGELEAALGWIVLKLPSAELHWHDGGTGGYRTCFGMDRRAGRGVVVLTNTGNMGGGDIVFHLLAGRPLAKLPTRAPARTAIAVTATQLAPLVGTYELTPQVRMAVTQDGPRLFAQITGQAKFEMFGEKPDFFFWKVVDAQVTFQRGADGRVTGAVIHQQGRDTPARRIDP